MHYLREGVYSVAGYPVMEHYIGQGYPLIRVLNEHLLQQVHQQGMALVLIILRLCSLYFIVEVGSVIGGEGEFLECHIVEGHSYSPDVAFSSLEGDASADLRGKVIVGAGCSLNFITTILHDEADSKVSYPDPIILIYK